MKFIPFFSFARKQLFARFRSKQVLVEQAHSQEELLWEFALYVEGQDDLLDEWIVGLRQQLRSSDKVIDGALITAAHEAMSNAVTARRNSLDKQLQSLYVLSIELGGLCTPECRLVFGSMLVNLCLSLHL